MKEQELRNERKHDYFVYELIEMNSLEFELLKRNRRTFHPGCCDVMLA